MPAQTGCHTASGYTHPDLRPCLGGGVTFISEILQRGPFRRQELTVVKAKSTFKATFANSQGPSAVCMSIDAE